MARKPFNPDRVKIPLEQTLFASADRPISVSQLTIMIKRALSRLPGPLAVEGEISNVSQSGNGHIYFTLKDPTSCVDCVIWRSDAARLKFRLADGLAVVAIGQVDVYEPRGRYQLYVTRLLARGRGELELAFRQLHEKLAGLGWFDAGRKRPIPRIPQTIGLVTSLAAAAVRDVLRTLAIRWPVARVVLADARVQGEGGAESVAAAIGLINRHAAAIGGVDVLIVARGGGSLEDLWAFNTETVARAILDSQIPVVSGVGHEIDTTIADLVADLRAATPTAAAQVVVPDQRDIRASLDASARLLGGAIRRRLSSLAGELDSLARHEPFRRPMSMIQSHRQRLDELAGRLRAAARELLHRIARRLSGLTQRLQCQHPRARLLAQWRRVDELAGRLRWRLARSSGELDRFVGQLAVRFQQANPVVERARRLESLQRQLSAFDPRAVLARGYSITTIKADGMLVSRAEQAPPGTRLLTELADGRVESEVTGGGGRPARSRRRRADDTNEPDLFCDGADNGRTQSE